MHQKEDKRIDRTNTRCIRGSFSHRCRSPRQPARWLLRIILAHCLSSCSALLPSWGFSWKDNWSQRVCKSWRLLHCSVLHDVVTQANSFLTNASFCIFLLWTCPNTAHRLPLVELSPWTILRVRTMPFEGELISKLLFERHCSGFTVWIKLKQRTQTLNHPWPYSVETNCAMEGVSWGNKSLKKRTRVNQIWAYREEKRKIFICKSDWNARYEIRCQQYLPTDRIWPSDGSLARRGLEDLKLSTIYSCEQLYASIKNQKCPETVCKAKYWDTKQFFWKMLH